MPMEGVPGLPREVLDRARRSRDPRFDGKFFIAVTSTRIYCRSICPARVSKDANVRYYASAAAAAEAGFRPCLRCRPETAPGSPAWAGTSAVVRRALRLIQDGALDTQSVEQLATHLGVGGRHLGRLFLRHVGASPAAVGRNRRLHFAKQLLDETTLPITDVAFAAGFGSIRRFNDVFKQLYRRPPRELRKRDRQQREENGAQIILRLAYRPPYDWGHTLDFLARHAIPGVETVDASSYARTVRTRDGHARVSVGPAPGVDALELRVTGATPAELLGLTSSVRRMFDLTADPAKIGAVLRGDATLRALVDARPGLRIPGTWDPFECGVRAILGQQISDAAAVGLLGRLIKIAGEPIAQVGNQLTHLFPTPTAIANALLNDLGVPLARREALRALATAIAQGRIDFSVTHEQLMRALMQVPGIGKWSAEYIALRGLGELDAFPYGDLFLCRQASLERQPLAPKALEARADAWRPFRGYAAFHLWAASTPHVQRNHSFKVRRQPVPALPQS